MRTAYVRWQAVLDAFRNSRAVASPAERAPEPPPALPSSRAQLDAARAKSRSEPEDASS
jgi:hypothetical protein